MVERVSKITEWKRGIKYPTGLAEGLSLASFIISTGISAFGLIHGFETKLDPLFIYSATTALSFLPGIVLYNRPKNKITIEHNNKKFTFHAQCPHGIPEVVHGRGRIQEKDTPQIKQKILRAINDMVSPKARRVADIYFGKPRKNFGRLFLKAPIEARIEGKTQTI
jgi:hypothetical protein